MIKKILLVILIILILLVLAVVVLFAVKGSQSRTGKALGMDNGQLQACPNKPNCVNSEFANDTEHYTPAISLDNSQLDSAETAAKQALESLGGTIKTQSNGYIAAEFTSSIFGFVDDFELRLDRANQQLHLRSASRVGHSDLGANAKRVNAFKAAFSEKLKAL